MMVEHCHTTTPLAAGGVYQSAWQRVTLYPRLPTDTDIQVVHAFRRVRGIVVADQNSAINGLVVQFSVDGLVAVSWAPPQNVVANVPVNIDVAIFADFVRVQYTNGVVAQAAWNCWLWLTESD